MLVTFLQLKWRNKKDGENFLTKYTLVDRGSEKIFL